jgi:hypothetical protein
MLLGSEALLMYYLSYYYGVSSCFSSVYFIAGSRYNVAVAAFDCLNRMRRTSRESEAETCGGVAHFVWAVS